MYSLMSRLIGCQYTTLKLQVSVGMNFCMQLILVLQQLDLKTEYNLYL